MSKLMFKYGRIFAFFLFFLGAGWWMSWSSKDVPDMYVDTNFSGSRDPAAIRKSYDFSELDGFALSQATKQRLIAGAKILKENASVGVELGHFVVRGEAGDKAFACNKYTQVVLQFEGDGMAVAGQKPVMEVEGACEISADINRISPLWIPVAKILGEPVAEGEFDFREGRPIKVKFRNVSDQWPVAWVLKGVKLQADGGDALTIEGTELRHYIPKPMIVEFQ
ncbi:MAG: hypothetical protein ACK5P7_00600 [Bdellovibrio sp.]